MKKMIIAVMGVVCGAAIMMGVTVIVSISLIWDQTLKPNLLKSLKIMSIQIE